MANKEKQEYDYEGDMAMSQLKSIIANAQRMHDMLELDTNLPEWVQSKITLAEDYISTASNYLQGEMKEETLDELSKDTLKSYLKKKKEGPGKDYPDSLSFRKAMLSPGIAKAKLGKTPKRRVLPDVKVMANEETKWIKDKYGSGHTSHDGKREIVKHPKGWINRSTTDKYDYSDVYPTQREAKANKYTMKEETTHSVHVKTYDSQGQKQMNSPEFKKHVAAHGGELDYPSDKGAAFKFKSASHAAAFHRGVKSMFRELGSEHDMYEEVAANSVGAGNIAGLQGDPPVRKKKKNVMSFNRFMKK